MQKGSSKGIGRGKSEASKANLKGNKAGFSKEKFEKEYGKHNIQFEKRSSVNQNSAKRN
jgi:hypothetical protein